MGVFDLRTAYYWKYLCDSGKATSILLFKLCLDTLVRELMRMNKSNCFAIHAVQTNQIERIQNAFWEHGIRLVLRSEACDPKAHSLNINSVMRMNPDLPIPEYKVVAETMGQRHEIHFELFHNSPFLRCT